MGYELAEQMDWSLPDVVIYPTGGGTGLIGMWKAFAELEQLGWIGQHRRPRMISVQAEGCAPIVRPLLAAMKPPRRGKVPTLWLRACASQRSRRFLMLQVLRESGGTAIAVSDEELIAHSHSMAAHAGIFPHPKAGQR